MEKLTDRQQDILDIIKKLTAKKGYPPTVREIGEAANLHSPATIHFHLMQLVKKGYISKEDGSNRTIEILVPNEYLDKNKEVVKIPLIDDKGENNKFITIPFELIKGKKEVFAVRVNDNKMGYMNICKEDILLVEKQKNTTIGKTVVTMDKELTVKVICKEDDIDKETILGNVIGLYRKF